ncbi:similar to spore coat protein [Sporobacter termitidis DSM 10068]|uniref:Similar to spore coat protein n=1 Tax=Sporobacter termitidis DSM 10068 TaxID=1123282 RepID=A0A1M5YGU8_9FIRM|nr:spore coat protein [Sporobacter termitidis]SHI11255.1 similar to spore coat protein [Sporobacter termitidis DSM 10068]
MAPSAPAETALSRLTDQVIAADLLISAKAGIQAYAAAISSSSTPAVRNLLKKQLDQTISFQEQVSSYIAERGWYNAYDAAEQLKTDAGQAQNTLSLLR